MGYNAMMKPSIRIVKEGIVVPWSTPNGTQALQVYGTETCKTDGKPCGVVTSSERLNVMLKPSTEYRMLFNVGTKSATPVTYRAQFAADNGGFDSNLVLARTIGVASSAFTSVEDELWFVTGRNDRWLHQRLVVRLLGGDAAGNLVFDNI